MQAFSDLPSTFAQMMPDVWVWGRRALQVAGVGVALSAVALGLLARFQTKLIYVPRIPGMKNDFAYLPDNFNLGHEDVELTAADGTKLHAWYLHPRGWSRAQRRRRPTILFLQENAGNMSWRLPFLDLLLRYLQCSALAPSYRGYGLSQGSPSQTGLAQDAQAALDHLLSRDDVDPKQITVMGKSLGGAVAIHLAAANPGRFRAVVIENTFTSIEDVAHKVLPPLKFVIGREKLLNFLVTEKWRNYVEIAKIRDTPVLLLSALQDEMLPPAQMRELYDIASSAGAKDVAWVEFPEAHHMDAYEVSRNQYWPALIHFMGQHHPQMDGASTEDGASEDSDGFEEIAREPVVQAMREAKNAPGGGEAEAAGVRARHTGGGGDTSSRP